MNKAILIAPLLAFSCSAAPSYAQEPLCDQTIQMYMVLSSGYGESQHTIGLNKAGDAVMETWANEETGSWTILATSSSGVSCIIFSGQNFSDVSGPEGDPA